MLEFASNIHNPLHFIFNVYSFISIVKERETKNIGIPNKKKYIYTPKNDKILLCSFSNKV